MCLAVAFVYAHCLGFCLVAFLLYPWTKRRNKLSQKSRTPSCFLFFLTQSTRETAGWWNAEMQVFKDHSPIQSLVTRKPHCFPYGTLYECETYFFFFLGWIKSGCENTEMCSYIKSVKHNNCIRCALLYMYSSIFCSGLRSVLYSFEVLVATAEVFFLAGVQFQHTYTHLFRIHKINFIKPGKKSRKQKTYSCKVWRGRKKEGETLVNSGGRAQMVRSAFHLFSRLE